MPASGERRDGVTSTERRLDEVEADEAATAQYEYVHSAFEFSSGSIDSQPMESPTPSQSQVRDALVALGASTPIIAGYDRLGRVPLGARSAVAAQLMGDRNAVEEIQPDGTRLVLSWREFDRLTTAVAAHLRRTGVRNGGWVLLELPNGVAHIVTTHATWRLGATVVPLGPTPVSSSGEHASFPNGFVVRADVLAAALQARPTADEGPVPLFGMPDPFAILPTGGSTGTPRFVAQAGTLWGRFDSPPDALRQGYGLRSDQKQLVCLPLNHGFGFGYANVFGLAYGHSLHVLTQFDARMALDIIEQSAIEFLAVVPTMLGRMASTPGFARRDLRSIEVVLHAGGMCPAPVKRRWMERVGPERVYEAYGATDVSLDCSIRGDAWLERVGSVGRPRGADVRVLDPFGRQLPAGAEGEICIRPKGRGRHPEILGAGIDEGHGFRSTGDRGRVDGDGFLYVTGRADDAIDVGGLLVRPGPVEDLLRTHPDVEDAAVFGVSDEDLGEHVEAAIEARDGHRCDLASALFVWCARKLARPERPVRIHIVDQVPRTDAGKLQRSVLAERVRSAAHD